MPLLRPQFTETLEFLEYCVDQLNLGNEQDLNLPKRLKVWHGSGACRAN
jgi:hypothetical protein